MTGPCIADKLHSDSPTGNAVTVKGDLVHTAPPALRRMVLAVAVLFDVDLLPEDTGVLLAGPTTTHIEWDVVSAVVRAARPAQDGDGDAAAQQFLADWLIARHQLTCGAALHALGFPSRHESHPGPAWIRERVPGGALTLGFGYGDANAPLPAGVLEHAGVDIADAWPAARDALEALGTHAVERDRRRRNGPLRPMGTADVVTLLGAASLRAELVAAENDGLAALVVPLRTRGWRATSITDPAFGPALAAAMPPEERGFDRPLLVTADEVCEVRPGGNPTWALHDSGEACA